MSIKRPITDFPRDEAGLVDNYIGTAYDVVKGVYENLETIRDLDSKLGNKFSSENWEINFQIPTSTSLNFACTTLPLVKIGNPTYRLVPVTTTIINDKSPYNPNLFEPVNTLHGGMAKFRYVGDAPIYGIIRGSLNFLLRVDYSYYKNNKPVDREYLLWLVCENAPEHSANAEGNYRRLLAVKTQGSTSYSPTVIDKSVSSIISTDPIIPPNNTQISDYDSYEGINLYEGSQHGFFSTAYSSNSETLTTSDANGQLPPEVRTTKWMDVENLAKDNRMIFFNFKGESTVCRVQIKRADGSIYVDKNQYYNKGSSRRYIRVPLDASYMRVHYSGAGNTVELDSIMAIPLHVDNSMDQDVRHGGFIPINLEFNTSIIFYPGSVYSFGLTTESELIDDDFPILLSGKSYRILSGGFIASMKGKPYSKDKDVIYKEQE